MKGFGVNLKRLRKKRGLKQQDLAERLGVERPTVA
ncbi:MAG: helix-turn-helix transcriptional regulator, partial [Desulfotomaculales bacterium]